MNDLAYYLILLVVVIVVGLLNPKRERSSARNRVVKIKEPKPAKKPKPTPSFRSDSPDHEHITSSGLSVQRRLEQLETLKEAGLLDKEEYEEKRREIEKEG